MFFTAEDNVDKERMRIASDGLVGINQTTPTSMLHIGGSGAAADSAALKVQDSDGNCYFNPESTDQPWSCSSDIKLK